MELASAGPIDKSPDDLPVVAGSGKRLFGDSKLGTTLRLAGSLTTQSGVVVLTDRPAG